METSSFFLFRSKRQHGLMTHIVMDAFNSLRDARREVREIPLCKVRITQVASACHCTQVVDGTVLNCIKIWSSFRPLNTKHRFFKTHWHSRAIHNFYVYTLYLICYMPMYYATVDCRFLKQHTQTKFWDLVKKKKNVPPQNVSYRKQDINEIMVFSTFMGTGLQFSKPCLQFG